MKAITAVPASVKEIFQKDYLIPNFQRPYSWGKDECEKFWDDILNFYGNKELKSEQYFFGNIVVYPSDNPEVQTRQVVDGQQRLTTLTLLLKALFDCARTWQTLEQCLKITDPKTGNFTSELRVKTHVIAKDREALEEIIFDKIITNPKSNFVQNFDFFKEKINEWNKNRTATEFDSLVSMILDQVVILPINCETSDDALTIFETINNRGKPLDDSDIFKAKLYGNAKNKDEFMRKWNELKDREWIFRVYMHILRAKSNDTNNEIALRKYFETKGSKYLENCEDVMKTLRLIHKTKTEFESNDRIISLWQIMNTYPNQYWTFPLYVFLHKYGKFNDRNNIELKDKKKLDEFRVLMEETMRYFFLKGVAGQGGAVSVKETIYRVYSKIELGGDYLQEYKNNISKSNVSEFNAHLEGNQLGRCYKGLVLISAYLNPRQDMKKFADLLEDNKYDIEHILPRVWNNYDTWDEETHREDINLLGNLMPLSRKINIKASNEFFTRKKEKYKDSDIQDALDMLNIPSWTRERLLERNNEKISYLKEFFGVN